MERWPAGDLLTGRVCPEQFKCRPGGAGNGGRKISEHPCPEISGPPVFRCILASQTGYIEYTGLDLQETGNMFAVRTILHDIIGTLFLRYLQEILLHPRATS
jgi:hypothetical protein